MTVRRGPDREHVVLFDRVGHARYHDAEGRPFLDPERYDLTLVTPQSKLGSVVPEEAGLVIGTDDDPASMLGILREVAHRRPVHHLAAISERLLLPIARLRAELGVGGPQPELIVTLRDKLAMKRRVAAAGVRVPESMTITRADDARELLQRHGAVVLKPTAGMGSHGVHVVRTPDDLRALDDLPDTAQETYEAEEFVDGEMVHVDSVVVAGRAIASTAGRYLEPTTVFGSGRPLRSVTVAPGPTLRRLGEFTDRVLAAYPDFSGVTHLELFCRPDGELVFCEIAGRPGGGGVIPMFRHRYGVDLYEASLRGQLDPASMGELLPAGASPAGRRRETAMTGWIGLYAGPGELLDVSTPQDDWVVHRTVRKHAGTVLAAPTMSGDAVVFVTVAGPDVATVTARLDEVAARSVIRVGPLRDAQGPSTEQRGSRR